MSLALGAAGLPSHGFAQTRNSGKPYRIALLPDLTVGPSGLRKVLTDTLAAAGRMEGRDYLVLPLGIVRGQDLDRSVRRVVDENPDLIIVGNTGYAAAAQRLTQSTPIVMALSGFPVEAGVANSLARPGRNVTGVTGYAGTGVFGKHLQLLRETKLAIKRFGVLWGYVPPFFPREEVEPCYAEIRDAARRLAAEALILEIAGPEQIDAALATLAAERVEALVLTSASAISSNAQRILNFATQNRLPTLTDYRWLDSSPVLLSYGAPIDTLLKQAVNYVDRILWGDSKPGDLPIQLPAKFEFIVNLRTAKALGLTVPQSLLLRADEVIQ